MTIAIFAVIIFLMTVIAFRDKNYKSGWENKK